MSKIKLFVLKEDISCAIGILHDAGLLHVEQIHLSKIMEQRGVLRVVLSPEEEKERLNYETLLKELNELISLLPKSLPVEGIEFMQRLKENSSGELSNIVSGELKPKFRSFTKEIASLKEELKSLPQYKQVLESFQVLKRELKPKQDYACLALIFDKSYEKDMQIFKRHMEDKTKASLELYTAALDSKKIVSLLFYPPQIFRQIDEEIFKKGTKKLELPRNLLSQPLNEAIKYIESRLKEIPQAVEVLNRAIDKFIKENLSLIYTLKTTALNRLEEIQVRANFLESKYTAVISGWLPTKDLKRLNQDLEKSLGENFIIYDRTRFVNKRDIPVLLENPLALKPYELLLRLLSPPRYGTMDATSLLSLFFPLFFGLIVGDIGYGLIFLVTSLCLKKSPKFFIRSIGSILFAVSLSTIFFGFLYGELLGNLGKDYLKLPHILFNRHESIIPFLILAVSVGVFHIVLGFLLGIIESWRKRHKKEVMEKISILAGLAGLFLLVASIMKILPSGFLPPSIVLLVVVTILLIFLRGFLGPLEIISAVANILSYTRIMALGLAGVMMANIANHIGGLSENIFIGVILASLLHALNLILSVFSPTIQSLRLHYVEFFSKFYEPGGKKYNPFRKMEVRECILLH